MNRETIIQGLKQLADVHNPTYMRDIANGALVLIEEKEPKKIKKTCDKTYGVTGGICPNCNNWIQSAHSFCGFCGQKVNWDG